MSDPYDIVTVYKRKRWSLSTPRQFRLLIWDMDEQRVHITNRPLWGIHGIADFTFPLNHKQITLNEPFATTVHHMQKGGKVVDRKGWNLKTISMSGTTGVRPAPIKKFSSSNIPYVGGVLDSLGFKVDLPDELTNHNPFYGGMLSETGLESDKEMTGFDYFMFLQNMIRYYQVTAWDPQWNTRLIMLYLDGKKNEWWIVEPLSFDEVRDSSNPFAHQYQITAELLAPFAQTADLKTDYLDKKDKELGFFGYINGVIDTINASFSVLEAIRNEAMSFVGRAVNVVIRLADATVGNAYRLRDSYVSMKNDLARIAFASSEQLKSICRVAKDNASASEQVISDAGGDTSQVKLVNHHLRTIEFAAIQLSNLLQDNGVSHPPISDKIKAAAVPYFNQNDDPRLGGDPGFIGNAADFGSAVEAIVMAGENIHDVAKRLTGKWASWKELVLINNLKPPYISDLGSANVLKPGDKILVPLKSFVGTTEHKGPINTDANMRSQSLMEIALGRDMKLREFGGIFDKADIELGASGDYAMIDGFSNFEQACNIKVRTPSGALVMHEDFGADFSPGMKPNVLKMTELELRLVAAFLSDNRVQRIPRSAIFAEGNVMKVIMAILLRGSSDTISYYSYIIGS